MNILEKNLNGVLLLEQQIAFQANVSPSYDIINQNIIRPLPLDNKIINNYDLLNTNNTPNKQTF